MNSVLFFPHGWKGAFEYIRYSYKDANLFVYVCSANTFEMF